MCFLILFFFIDAATSEFYTLSVHDALPISRGSCTMVQPLRLSPMGRHLAYTLLRSAILTAIMPRDRKSTRLNSSHTVISYTVFCLKKKNTQRVPSYAQAPRPQALGIGYRRP